MIQKQNFKHKESLPLTDMWYISGRVESIVLRRKVEGFFHDEVGTNEENRFLYYKGQVFVDMSDPYLKGNKEGNRPHYYCFEDTCTGIYWMIAGKVHF